MSPNKRPVEQSEDSQRGAKKSRERRIRNVDVQVASMDSGLETLQVSKSEGYTDLSLQYKLKINESNVKQTEQNAILNEFEHRISRKKQEQAPIKKEEADIALTINKETIKSHSYIINVKKKVERNKERHITNDLQASVELQENNGKSSVLVKYYDMTRRRLSIDADPESSYWSLRQHQTIAHNRHQVQSGGDLRPSTCMERVDTCSEATTRRKRRAGQIE